MTAKKQDIFRKTMWFDKKIKFDIDFFDCMQPLRKVSAKARYKSGLFYSEKCQRNIQYESGLELAFIKQLESSKRVKFYYEQPVRIVYYRGRKKESYTPDFGIYLTSKEFILVEIKDLPGMLNDRVQLKVEALMDFCSKKGFGFLLTDGRNTFDKLLKSKYNIKLERHILAALNDSVIRKTQCKEIMQECGATPNELYKTIIRQNLKFRSFPLKLQQGNKSDIFRQVFIEKKRFNDLEIEPYPTLFKS